MASESVLVPLQLEHVQQEASLLDYSLRCTRGAVYLYCTGEAGLHQPLVMVISCRGCRQRPPGRCLPAPHPLPLTAEDRRALLTPLPWYLCLQGWGPAARPP